MDNEYQPVLEFTDPSDKYTYGFEAGTIWVKMGYGERFENHPVHTVNKVQIQLMANHHGYDCQLEEAANGWTFLTAKPVDISAIGLGESQPRVESWPFMKKKMRLVFWWALILVELCLYHLMLDGLKWDGFLCIGIHFSLLVLTLYLQLISFRIRGATIIHAGNLVRRWDLVRMGSVMNAAIIYKVEFMEGDWMKLKVWPIDHPSRHGILNRGKILLVKLMVTTRILK